MKERLPEHAKKRADQQHQLFLSKNKNATALSNHILHYLGLDNKRYVVSNIAFNVVVILDRQNLYRTIKFIINNDDSEQGKHYFEINESFFDNNVETFFKDYQAHKDNSLFFVESLKYSKNNYDKGVFRSTINDSSNKTIEEYIKTRLIEKPINYNFTLDDYYKTKQLCTTYEWFLSKGDIPFNDVAEMYSSLVFRELFGIEKLHIDDFKIISNAYDNSFRDDFILKYIDKKPAFFDLLIFDENDRLTEDSIELMKLNYKK